MHSCPSCRAEMLEYLYDLLDESERRAMQEHLDACANCRAELDRARGQQQLLKTAARMEFPGVRFVAPAEQVEAVAPTAVLPMTRPATKMRPWRRWAAAAAVLLALAGAGVPGYWAEHDYAQARRVVEEKEAVALAAQGRSREAVQQLLDLPRQEREKVEEVRKAERERQMEVAVVGQPTVSAGAPATYEIQTTNLDGAAVGADVSVRVAEEGKAPAGDPLPVVKAGEGRYAVTLPADLPLKPNSRLNLVVSARREAGIGATVSEQVNLVAPVYNTFLETDKPMYQPGEVVHYRSLTLDRFNLRPAEEDLRLTYELVTPTRGRQALQQNVSGLRSLEREAAGKGAAASIPTLDGKPVRGVGAGDFVLDPTLEGGEYTLVCREENNRFQEQRRKFLVNNYPRQQLNKELDFNRSTYGPGDEVAARCKAIQANGEPLRNQPVEATVLIDDKLYGADGKETNQPLRLRTDEQGTVVVRFRLPPAIERGAASLGVKFLGGAVETITRPLPIVLKKLNVEFYPEGGDLAADLPNRVYFQVRTPLGKPADLKGRLLEDGTPLAVEVETLHDDQEPGVNQGMGRFEFTPRSGKKYELQIDSPAGVADHVALPEVKDDRVVLSVADGAAAAGQPIKATVLSKKERTLMVGLYCRGRLLHSVRLKKGETEALLNPTDGAGGVCRVTVFEEVGAEGDRRELKPAAERLVYRQPAEFLKVNLKPDRTSYVLGQKASLRVETRDENGKPAPAVVMVAVVDKSVLTLADEKTHKSMPTHFLLADEVRRPEDLEYADFLLGPQAKAGEALDLLLGVQGWRRFAEQDPDQFRRKDADKEEAERLLYATGRSAPRKTELAHEEIAQVEQQTDAKEVQLREQARAADGEAYAALADPTYLAAEARVEWYAKVMDWVRRLPQTVTPLGTLLLLAALVFAVLGLRRGLRRGVLLFTAAAACAALMAAAISLHRPFAPMPKGAGDGQMAQLQQPRPEMPAPLRDAPVWAVREKDKAVPEAEGMTNKDKAPVEKGAVDAASIPPAAMPDGDKRPDDAKGGARVFHPLAMAPAAPPPAPGFAPPVAAANGPAGLGGAKPGAGGGAYANNGALRENPPNEDLQERLEKQFAGRPFDDNEQAKRQLLDLKKADGAAKDGLPGDAAKDKMETKEGERDADEVRRALLWQRNRERLGAFRGAAAGGMAVFDRAAVTAPMVVREYAHDRRGEGADAPRSDFAETLYWHPVLVLPDGTATVTFDLCDSATTFQATAYAHTPDGRLGAGVKLLESRLPLTVQPATPLEVTASDVIDVPVSVANNTADRRDVRLTVTKQENLSRAGDDKSTAAALSVDAGKTARPVYRFRPTVQEGEAVLEFTGKADGFAADGVRAKVRVAPEGFPVSESRSDVLEGSASQTLTLPETWVKGTLKCQVQVFPSTLADLQKGLEGLLREPNGCFEQTSTSNYPNLLILNYLKESNQTNPEVERRARDLLARGYQKLTSFECTNPAKSAKEGYEWFGGTTPPHEALTAYGLLQFRDMAKVQEVDPAMLKRTQDYLLSRRDGKGGFQRNPRALDSFGRAPDDVTDAYIVWALTESGKGDDVTKELNALADRAKTSKDPYFLSLVANGLINRARTEEATALLQTVAGGQKEDGHLDAEKTSITGSGGRDLQIETTALAVLGWLKTNPGAFHANLDKAVKWVGQQRGGYGGFGSTQSTILALKALIAYTTANKRTAEGGELRLFVGDKEAAKLSFPAGASEALALELKDAENVLHPGRNDVRVEITGKNTFPYTLAWTYQTLKPASPDDCPVRLATKLSRTEVNEGDLVRLNVTLENVSGKGQGMAVAVLGLPGGLTVPPDMKQLKLYTRLPEDGSRPLVDAFEIRGRELVLYWRDLAPGRKIAVPLDLVARVPGEYSGPASRGYLYYNADHKHWVDPLRVTIAAKAE